MNWRSKDSTPRAESSPQPRNQRSFNANRDETRSPSTLDSGAPGTRLYVGNLLYTASRSDVEQLFTDNGFAISGISMSVDPFTGRNPSYAFVDFETPEEANRAMENLNGMEIHGRNVRINPGVRKQGDGTGVPTKVRNYEGRRGRREERGEGKHIFHPCSPMLSLTDAIPVPSNYKPTFDRYARNDASTHFQQNAEQGLRLYVGSLPRIEPQAAADAQMQELFGSEGVELTAVSKMISPHPSKASDPGNHYYCFVDLANADDVERAIEALNGREIEGWGAIRVNKAKNNQDRKVNREHFGYQSRNGPKPDEVDVWRRRQES
jgi:RNA recognition motif-containing protein